MASLMEELVSIMEAEDKVYRELLPIADQKTRIIIKNDLEALQDITDKEQLIVEKVTALEGKRTEVIRNIGVVLNKKPETLNMKELIKLFQKQPEEQKKLSKIHDSLKSTLARLIEINDRNKSLIQQSLEMIEFNMNLIQSTRMSPGTNNYTRNASQYDAQSLQTGMFDAKQ